MWARITNPRYPLRDISAPSGIARERGAAGHYSKIENGQREASVEMLDKLAKFYGITIDKIVHPNNEVPTEVVIEDKTAMEQLRLIQELEDKDRSIVFAIIDKMLTTKKFKDFFNNNAALL